LGFFSAGAATDEEEEEEEEEEGSGLRVRRIEAWPSTAMACTEYGAV
jgi:hypothetical protein